VRDARLMRQETPSAGGSIRWWQHGDRRIAQRNTAVAKSA